MLTDASANVGGLPARILEGARSFAYTTFCPPQHHHDGLWKAARLLMNVFVRMRAADEVLQTMDRPAGTQGGQTTSIKRSGAFVTGVPAASGALAGLFVCWC